MCTRYVHADAAFPHLLASKFFHEFFLMNTSILFTTPPLNILSVLLLYNFLSHCAQAAPALYPLTTSHIFYENAVRRLQDNQYSPLETIETGHVAQLGSCDRLGVPRLVATSETKINWPLCDGRAGGLVGSEFRQCRALCGNFNHPDIQVFQIYSGCLHCNQSDTIARHVTSLFNYDRSKIDFLICIPRGECMANCGPEKPGCVYSGSCTSQTCFWNQKTRKTALIKRATHIGPGTVLQIETAKENVVVGDKLFDVLPTLVYTGGDTCTNATGHTVFYYRDDDQCDLTGQTPISDGKRSHHIFQSCRSICRRFHDRNYEVIQVSKALCNFCTTAKSHRFQKKTANGQRICIPRSICVEKCGPEPAGCIYSGSCQTLFCFSGIDSKLPADIRVLKDDGSNMTINVDNEKKQEIVDPPSFPHYTPQVSLTPFPSQNAVPSRKVVAKISPTTTTTAISPSVPEASTEVSEGGTENANKEGKSSKTGTSASKWVWLGPILGLLGAALPGIAYIGVAYCKKRQQPSSSREVFQDPDFRDEMFG